LSLIHIPSNKINPAPTTFLSTEKESLFQMQRRPPAALIEGAHSEATLQSAHKY